MSSRFKMHIENSNAGLYHRLTNNFIPNDSLHNQINKLKSTSRHSNLSSPMVSRIFNTPSGCSACGKRVMG